MYIDGMNSIYLYVNEFLYSLLLQMPKTLA